MPRPLVRARTALVAAVVGLAVVLSGALPAAAGVPASITGTVSGPDGPAAGVAVDAYQWDDELGWWSWTGSATTGDDGGYALDLEADGAYRLGFQDPSQSLTGGLLRIGEDGVAAMVRQFEDASDVVAPAVVDVTLAASGAIGGTVTDPAGPAAGITVSVYAQTFGWWSPQAETLTLDDGTYRIGGLEAGVEYRVRFADPAGARTGGYLRDDAGSVSLVADVVNATGVYLGADGVDVALPLATPITGTVSGPDGPLPSISVSAYRVGEWGLEWAGSAQTGEDGAYRLVDVVAGESYHLSFFSADRGLLDGWYRSVDGVASLTQHEMDATSVAAPAEGVDVTLAAAAPLSGVVTGPDGVPVAGVWVTALEQDEWGGWVPVEQAMTDGSGGYSIGTPAGGPYLVQVDAGTTEPRLRDGYYRAGGVASESQSAATPVTAPATGLDLELAGTVSISGSVNGPGGPATGVRIGALGWDEDSQRWVHEEWADVAEDGTFVVVGLADGAPYRLQFVADRWTGQGLLGGYLRETAAGFDMVRTVADATSVATPRDGIDVVLGLAPTITGTLVGPAGPDLGFGVQAWTPDEDGNWTPMAGGDVTEAGAFTIPSLEPTIPYVLQLQDLRNERDIGWYRTDAAGHVTYVEDIRAATRVEAPSSGLVLPVGAAPVASVPPAVSGSTQVGARLTATPGTWSVTGLTYEYEWLRSGVPVAGATSASYTLTSADLGARLAVRVVATKQGHATGEATSAQSAVVTAPPTTGTAPKALVKPFVLGLPKVGSPLLAFPGVWSATDVRLTFQWLRDGRPIQGATSFVYTPTTADKGAKLAVRVTATRTGAPAGTATSAETSTVTTWFGWR